MILRYFTENSFITLLSEIKTRIAEKVSKSEVDNLVLIETSDIDMICGTTIAMASEVMF